MWKSDAVVSSGAIRIWNSASWAFLGIRARVSPVKYVCVAIGPHARRRSVSVCIWNVIRWLVASHGYLEKFRVGRGRRESRGVCRERGCSDAAGRGKDRGHKRPARRDARGGAPSFVSFRRASLHLASSSPFSFLPADCRARSHPVWDVSRTDPRRRYLSFPFVRTGRRWYSAGIRRCGSLASAQPGSVYEGRPGGVCEKPAASLTPARCVASLHRDELIKKNRGSCTDISCSLCSRGIAVRRGKDGPPISRRQERQERDNAAMEFFIYAARFPDVNTD